MPYAAPRQQADQQAEEAVIEGQIKAEKKEQPQRGQRAYPAVLAHGVVDPVAGAGIPENSADVGQKKSLGRPGRQQFDSGLKLQGIWFPGPQKRDEQGSNRYPAQEIQIGQGENQNLQAGRQQDQQPRVLVHPPHVASITNVGRGRRIQTSDSRPRTFS